MENQEPEPIHTEFEVNMPQVSLAGHLLVQIGPTLKCVTCPYEHTYSIDAHLKYLGNDKQGFPITERI